MKKIGNILFIIITFITTIIFFLGAFNNKVFEVMNVKLYLFIGGLYCIYAICQEIIDYYDIRIKEEKEKNK